MQYTVNTVRVTNLSNVVMGNATDFIGAKPLVPNVKAGHTFKVEGDDVVYTIASVISDTEFRLNSVYEGATSSNATYQITRDFTPNLGLAEINAGDRDWAIHLTNGTIRKIDSLLGAALSNAEGGTVLSNQYPTNIQASTIISEGADGSVKCNVNLTWTAGSTKSNLVDIKFKLTTATDYIVMPVSVGTSVVLPDLFSGSYVISLRTISTNGTYSDWASIAYTVTAPYKKNVLELEDMKRNFQYISWAQFAVYDGFSDSKFRLTPETSSNPAKIAYGYLTTTDAVANKVFGYLSKSYTDITTIFSGICTLASPGVFQDGSKSWFVGETTGLIFVDSSANAYPVTSNTSNRITTNTSAVAGAYKLKTTNPSYLLAMASYSDSSNGGYGYAKLEVSFNGGGAWQTILDTQSSIDRTGGTIAINTTGSQYQVRITLTNDAQGRSPYFYNYLIATDPSPWRF